MAGENDDLNKKELPNLTVTLQNEIKDLNNEINVLIVKFNEVDNMRAKLLKENEDLRKKINFIEFIIKSK